MLFDEGPLAAAGIILDRVRRQPVAGPYPESLNSVLSEEMAEEAWQEITAWPSYAPTPLRSLEALAGSLGISALFYKDEGERLGLGSFKALGGSYAVLQVAARWLSGRLGRTPSLAEIRSGAHAEQLRELTVVTATDGNHGRSVAWGAQVAGCRCRIYIHAHVSKGREEAMAALGAEMVRIAGDYDESLRLCAQEASDNGWIVVSDTSYEGYMDLPRYVMAGYSVMVSEVLDQMKGAAPTHVFIQAGVGGLAASVVARLWQCLGSDLPHVVIVEPERAACCLESARRDRPMSVRIEEETMMAGLSCGEVSLLAWDVLSKGAELFVTIGEEQVAPVMRLLASGAAGGGRIVAGESAVPGLIGLLGVAQDKALREEIGLGPGSRVLVFGCEGATDPEIYRRLVGEDPASA